MQFLNTETEMVTELTISIVSGLLTLFYVALMLTYRRGWRAIPVYEAQKTAQQKISVIVPARNEAFNIRNCLDHLRAQNYPRDLYEVIVVDDHSTDNTLLHAENYKREKPWANLVLLELAAIPGRRYKKAAITEAIKIATGDIIITTDADCEMGPHWLPAIASYFEETEAALVSSPVVYSFNRKPLMFETNFFLYVQQLEFAGLVGIGGAAIQLGYPNMCNGANMAYRKEVFDEVGGYKGNDELLSGDDEFLMHKVHTRYPNGVRFLKSREAIVTTPPSMNWDEFWAQRTRWVSKSTKYSDKKITLLLTLAYLFNLSMLVNGVLGFISVYYLKVALIQVLLKALAEYMFYGNVLNFFRLKRLNRYILPAQPFHILYVLAIGILGNFAGVTWKGRKQ